jgi:Zn-dependent protease/predicted transcriptional regulator
MSHTLVARKNDLPVNKLTLFLFGGVSELTKEPSSARAEFKIAVAGPLSSIVIGIIFIGLALLGNIYFGANIALASLEILGYINIFLAVFNLLPGYPLDGGRILRAFFWWWKKDLLLATRWAAVGGHVIALLLIGFGVYEIIFLGNFGGIWLGFIGYFLYQSASAAYAQTAASVALENVKARELVNKEIEDVPADEDLDDAASRMFSSKTDYLIVKNSENARGIVANQDIGMVDQEEWETHTVGEIMHPIENFKSVDEETESTEAISVISQNELPVVPVKHEHRVIGLITVEDLSNYLNYKAKIRK